MDQHPSTVYVLSCYNGASYPYHLIPFPVEHSAFVEVLDRTVTPCKAIHNPTSAIQNGISRPCGSAAQRRNEHKVVLGRAAPYQTLPRVGEWGNPVSPFPCGAGAWGNPVSPHPLREPMFTVAVHAACAAPRRDEHTSWESFALPNPPTRWRDGETRFPYPPAQGLRPPKPSRGRGYGGTWFPYAHIRPHARGAQRPMQVAWERGRPARVAAPRARCRTPP